ncbi:TPA: LysR family transcriptional regulator [Klebsiella pneumoniae]|uniref:LysR family transcriptional regulator n=1 Tax=Enterobacteriaceae TaxID=543 RepID=UPI0020730A40|nr:LysR family transcriptional regulator [Enterobacter bugandensis]HBQ1079192.1 LysR family transcriptional regulator [Klebsiella pneumoniae]HBU9459765.1 LysR family transcriptional regulator [Klebsiella pneumoniae]HBV7394881.1 LysR family transcriptional regulator [Klebsiella pneumoniae]HBV7575953.1 LysR family transcriptional regulator [Klebsiella pneumoniae]
MNTTNLSGYLNQFQVLIKVAETGNLSRAARELGLTPSAVSKSLAQLESIVGSAVIVRETRPFQLTAGGRRILQIAHRVISDIEGIAIGNFMADTQTETLRISCSVAFGCTHIPRITGEYQQLHPGVNINVTLDDRLINLSRDEFDIALRISSEAAGDGLNETVLMDICWFYCASPVYLKRHPPISVPADLRFHQCLVYPQMTSEGKWAFHHRGKSETVKVVQHFSCNSSLLLLQRALANGGVACLPNYLASHYVDSGKLIRVLPEHDPGVTHRLRAVVSPSSQNSETVKVFLAFLQRMLGQKM